jgi:hypothetical protein
VGVDFGVQSDLVLIVDPRGLDVLIDPDVVLDRVLECSPGGRHREDNNVGDCAYLPVVLVGLGVVDLHIVIVLAVGLVVVDYHIVAVPVAGLVVVGYHIAVVPVAGLVVADPHNVMFDMYSAVGLHSAMSTTVVDLQTIVVVVDRCQLSSEFDSVVDPHDGVVGVALAVGLCPVISDRQVVKVFVVLLDSVPWAVSGSMIS